MSNDLAAISAKEECCIGNYILLNTIGTGSFAEVRMAWHILTSTEVAVKTTSQWGFSEVFQDVHCLKSLNHPK